ncbi:hypothetical protein HPB52_023534 [Rhipicephalus sanguineus]|uniref:Uncharacterized protein n=1 Tax=Rhipicephalus sanguineus TaxID=34632 RepID=A0A9D4YR48_RHISA|nr:hypothetical protein HPB52_023534 [Rhipicephalus sanguineus]
MLYGVGTDVSVLFEVLILPTRLHLLVRFHGVECETFTRCSVPLRNRCETDDASLCVCAQVRRLSVTMADHSELVTEMSVVEKMSTQERLKHAKKRRQQQLKKWSQHERELQKAKKGKASSPAAAPPPTEYKVHFVPSVMLLEAAARNDVDEGRYPLCHTRIIQSGGLAYRRSLWVGARRCHTTRCEHFSRLYRARAAGVRMVSIAPRTPAGYDGPLTDARAVGLHGHGAVFRAMTAPSR